MRNPTKYSCRLIQQSIDQLNDPSTIVRRQRSTSSSTNDSFESIRPTFSEVEFDLVAVCLVNEDSLSVHDPIGGNERCQCDIYLEDSCITNDLFCCSSSVCKWCLYPHLSTEINGEAHIKTCPRYCDIKEIQQNAL
jgi:hypothetical protein